jgi:hypothetical protein
MLLALVAAGIIPRGYSVSYTPGVKAGDWAKYSVTSYWHSSDPTQPVPELIAQVQGVSTMMITVLTVTADIVTATQILTFNNGTQPRTFYLQGSLLDGSGNVTGWIIAGGLSPGDKLFTAPMAPTINYTSVAPFGGALRSVNVFNFSFALGTISDFFALQFERYSGFSMEDTFSYTGNVNVGGYQYTARGLADIKLTQTSVTHAPPDFFITGSSSTTSTTGTKGNLTLTIHSENGFAGNVLLTASSSQTGAAINVQPAQVTVPIDGQVNATISLNSNTAGDYSVTITATAGSISHTKTDTFNVNTPPVQPAAFLGLQPVQLYALIGIVAAVLVAVTAFTLNRSRKQEPTTEAPPPSAPSTPPPPADQPIVPVPAPKPNSETT